MRVDRLVLCGDLALYERRRGHETWVPKYMIITIKDDLIVKEFRRRDSAHKWMLANYSPELRRKNDES